MRLILAASILLAGCATAPIARTFERTAAMQGPSLDATWNAVIDLFGERNWTIANMEKASGFINSDWMNSDRTPQYVDCGSAGMAVDQDRRGRFNIVVRQEQPTTPVSVTVNTTWQVTRSFAGTVLSPECVSTGVLESEIHTELRRRLTATP